MKTAHKTDAFSRPARQLLVALLLLGGGGGSAFAATRTWNGSSDSDWANGANWSLPGIPSSVDTVIFNGASAPSGGAAGSVDKIYFESGVSALNVNPSGLTVQSHIEMLEGVTSSIAFGSAIGVGQGTTFANNASHSAATLNFTNSISSTASGSGFLYLSGTNTSTNVISGNISNGASSDFGLIKTEHQSTWVLSGSNTFTGVTYIESGNLILGAIGALAGTSHIQMGDIGQNFGQLPATELVLNVSNTVNDFASLRIEGATIIRGSGVSEGSLASAGMGDLVLSDNNSTIDFGIGTGGILRFNSITVLPVGSENFGNAGIGEGPQDPTALIIRNWTPGSEILLSTVAPDAYTLSMIFFEGFEGGETIAVQMGIDGPFEITTTAIPEPSLLLGGIVLGGIVCYRERCRVKALMKTRGKV